MLQYRLFSVNLFTRFAFSLSLDWHGTKLDKMKRCFLPLISAPILHIMGTIMCKGEGITKISLKIKKESFHLMSSGINPAFMNIWKAFSLQNHLRWSRIIYLNLSGKISFGKMTAEGWQALRPKYIGGELERRSLQLGW